MKIRLEELGGSAAEDTMKEYKEVKERDDFLARELADLEKSTATLQGLINELEEKLNVEFQNGIEHISKEFGAFFELMFGGGSAKLLLVQEEKRRKQPGLLSLDEESESDDAEINDGEEGVDISVSLPNKKIRGLAMLSGGERALTSIALIFAMSQVNPPPFLILDETDAALDEANSRRYGDMIENLAKKSELIVITHNRETMSRAGILYGVTMGSDGISKLLSVKFEEAVAVAK
jgi:chromosome segregation protein